MTKPSRDLPFISNVYYYVALSILSILIAISVYWQLEEDMTVINYQESEFYSTAENRQFYIPISFCNTRISSFQIHRYYQDTIEGIYYSLPTSQYLAQYDEDQDCFQTMLMSNTLGLQSGIYEYRVFISYHVNPVQENTRLITKAYVTVE